MKSVAKERIQAKLKLWETPGFSQFIGDLEEYSSSMVPVTVMIESLRKIYNNQLKQIEAEESVSYYRQGKLPL
jgi:hypothetical protein